MSQTSENEICLEMIAKRIFFKPFGLYIFHVIVSPLPQKCPLTELISVKLRHWKSGRSLQWAERTTGSPASQQIQQSLGVNYPSYNGFRYVNSGIIYPRWDKAIDGKKNHKEFPGVTIRKRMVREGRRNRKKCF